MATMMMRTTKSKASSHDVSFSLLLFFCQTLNLCFHILIAFEDFEYENAKFKSFRHFHEFAVSVFIV